MEEMVTWTEEAEEEEEILDEGRWGEWRFGLDGDVVEMDRNGG